jgi:hypothetical protein
MVENVLRSPSESWWNTQRYHNSGIVGRTDVSRMRTWKVKNKIRRTPIGAGSVALTPKEDRMARKRKPTKKAKVTRGLLSPEQASYTRLVFENYYRGPRMMNTDEELYAVFVEDAEDEEKMENLVWRQPRGSYIPRELLKRADYDIVIPVYEVVLPKKEEEDD